MIEPMTEEEFSKELGEVVARARRHPPRLERIAPPTDPEYQHRIVRDPTCCGGEPAIRGTRVTLRAILASLAEGDRPEEIVEAFPSLCLEDVRAAIAFATANSDEDLPQRLALLNAS